jgi:hypothetical protein
MASKTITFENLIGPGETPTDLDEPPTLADGNAADDPPTTPTYGLRRADTLEVILPAGTVLPRVGTGVYQLEVTGLLPGVEYDYTVRHVFEGTVDYDDEDFTVPGEHYTTIAKVRLKLGQTNEEAAAAGSAADVESTGDAAKIAAEEEEVLSAADDRVNLKAMDAGADLPLPAEITAKPYVWAQIVRAATLYAAGYLLKLREDQGDDETGDAEKPSAGDELIKEGDEIMRVLDERELLIVAAAPVAGAPAGVVRPDGARVSSSDLPRVYNTGPGVAFWPNN